MMNYIKYTQVWLATLTYVFVHDIAFLCIDIYNSTYLHSFFFSVVNQRFVPKVYDYYVIRGNTAVLRCHLPTSVKDYVSVESWIRNDDYVLRPSDTRGK
ncbi:hypothetical protein CEXT_115371 [Caerostris extrusa]|uniref:Ig-like domain-containing protein n=1 Tax=Caerostris extrusa TaxID=172846 RepID=A0AAV4Y269_CAEEX|nr:hypothetical protein CEXT_115371 [Caerostris extrusa]